MLKTSSLCNVRVMSLPRRSAVSAFHAATCKGNRSGTCADHAIRQVLELVGTQRLWVWQTYHGGVQQRQLWLELPLHNAVLKVPAAAEADLDQTRLIVKEGGWG